MIRKIPTSVIELVEAEEKCVLYVYDDAFYPPRRARPNSKPKGCFTAGYGHTGKDVIPGMSVSKMLADAWLDEDLNEAAQLLTNKVGAKIISELTENQYAALIDFVYNLGTGSPKRPEWTIWKRIKAKQFDQVPLEMAKFVNDRRPDGSVRKLTGLVRRRNLEIELWSTGEPNAHEETLPSSVTRRVETPPTPADPVPVTQSKSFIAGAVGAVTAAPVMINQVTAAVTPYAKQSEWVEASLGILATIAAVCVAVGLIYMFISKRNARN